MKRKETGTNYVCLDKRLLLGQCYQEQKTNWKKQIPSPFPLPSVYSTLYSKELRGYQLGKKNLEFSEFYYKVGVENAWFVTVLPLLF